MKRLRFKDENGNEYPEWEKVSLESIGDFKTSSVNKKIEPNEERVYLVNYMDVYQGMSITKKNMGRYMVVTANVHQKQKFDLKKGDILFIPSSETPDDIGKSAVVYDDLPDTLYSYHLVRFRPSVKLDLKYANYFCNSPSIYREMSRYAQGATRFTISLRHFRKIKVAISQSMQEQRKIGRFLSAFDRLVEKQKKKVGLLKEIRKGYIQKIFSRELRFKDENGHEHPDWTPTKIKHICDVIGGGTPKTKVNEYWTSGLSWYTPNDIIQKKYVAQSNKSISSLGLRNSNAKLLPPGTILLSTRATIGEKAISLTECATNQGFQNLVCNRKKTDNEFMYYYLVTAKRYLRRLASGSTFTEVSNKSIRDMDIWLPVLEEQKKNGNFLSAIDRKIAQEEQKAEKYESLKKGYLQRLFYHGE